MHAFASAEIKGSIAALDYGSIRQSFLDWTLCGSPAQCTRGRMTTPATGSALNHFFCASTDVKMQQIMPKRSLLIAKYAAFHVWGEVPE
jgi:hypothetical protein